MTCYIISYDLCKPGRNYDSLYDAIKTYSKWAKIQESLWAIVTNNTAVEVRDHLQQYIDENDRIFVIRTGTVAAWRNAICDADWLKENLPKT